MSQGRSRNMRPLTAQRNYAENAVENVKRGKCYCNVLNFKRDRMLLLSGHKSYACCYFRTYLPV